MGISWPHTKPLLLILLPLLLLPLPLVLQDDVATFGYLLILVSLSWILELFPITLTSLIPMMFLPMVGLANPKELAKEYFPDTCMLFLGSLIFSAAIEKTGVHRRLALFVLKLAGRSLRSLQLGIMLVTWFLSMWISNTATAALMLPVLEAIFTVYENKLKDEGSNEELPTEITKGLTLSLAAAALVGGTATLTGTPPNLVCSSVMEEQFPCHEPPISFASWLIMGLPFSITLFLCIYIFENIYWFGLPFCSNFDKKFEKFGGDAVAQVITTEYEKLPSIQFNEIYVCFSLFSTVCLWFFRSPGFVKGWSDYYTGNVPSDSSIALFMGALFFVIPESLPKNSRFFKNPIKYWKRINFNRPILLWREFEIVCPWGILILIGSGTAISTSSKNSGFSEWMADLLSGLSNLPEIYILLIIVIFITFFTEVITNTAVTNLLLPILQDLAVELSLNPMYLLIPATLASSQAYMMPGSSGPNSLCFSYSRISVWDMNKNGLLLNLVGIAVIMMYSVSLIPAVFDINNHNQTWIYEPDYCIGN